LVAPPRGPAGPPDGWEHCGRERLFYYRDGCHIIYNERMDVTATVTGGRRAFFRAEQRGDENVMKLLLQLGDAKADGEDMKYGGIPLW